MADPGLQIISRAFLQSLTLTVVKDPNVVTHVTPTIPSSDAIHSDKSRPPPYAEKKKNDSPSSGDSVTD
jgi:hypothetical protein